MFVPFSIGWWAESDGTAAVMADGTTRHFPRGTVFRIAEWYGRAPNADDEGIRLNSVDIGAGIAEREKTLRERLGIRHIHPGPADASIFDRMDDESIAMKIDHGYARAVGASRVSEIFVPSNKAAGSRQRGLELLRTYLEAALARPMEHPGLFVFDTCADWVRTVPVLPRSEKDPEDVDTQAEDHAYDETRYRLVHERPRAFAVGFRL